MKICTKCKTEKPHSEFYLQYGKPISACKTCTNIANKKWVETNPEAAAAIKARWVERNPEKRRTAVSEWVARNYEQHCAAVARWASAHVDKNNAKATKHRAQKKRAAPVWANEFFIAEAYHLAQLRTKATGFKWHVDHIVPLQSPLVCGLHNEFNLQVVPGRTNQSKGNYRWPDMPQEAS